MSGQTPENRAAVTVYPGARTDNPYVYRGQDDIITLPVTYPRYATPDPHEVQLSNGLDRTNMGAIDPSAAASYLSMVSAFQPGQTRLSGTQIANFPMQGMAPAQWNAYVMSTAGSQPTYTGGPGTVNGNFVNPGTGA